MAGNGVRFTEFYSASPVCTPSRAALLTGRYPIRQGIHHVFFPESYGGLAPEETTIAEVLKASGYTTGMVGKWHLGHREKYLPLQQGFDEFFGVPYSNDMGGFYYIRGNTVIQEDVDQRYLTKTYTNESIRFIESHYRDKSPFFLYLAHSMPHVPLHVSPEFEGKSTGGLYGDVIAELDWSTGRILNKLSELGIEEKTLVVFSSDNGPWLMMGSHGV
ncbi:MAG: sulfatase-like hydrolase/transferase [Proteobacteria bacterium]|nr:sulfatase-like hydrolase/transferase [Pseudomonadota bacterium]